MVLEVAVLDIKAGQAVPFEAAFAEAEALITGMPGCLGHSLKRCLENDHRYLLLVEWETVEHHTLGFRGSAEYGRWKELLHPFYDPFPTVEHYR